MQHQVIISGFGGQGTLFAGQLLAYAAMDAGHNVTWIPSYGPEMRGGKARCTVIVSDHEIGSPLVRRPSSAIVLNIPSMQAFEPLVQPDGVLVINSSLIPAESQRSDLRALRVPATELAIELGDKRMANVICLAALVEATGIVSVEAIGKALEAHLPARHRDVLPMNHQALARGASFAEA